MDKTSKKKYFKGYNKIKVEAEVDEFIKELGDRVINVTMTSTNPQYVFVVEYKED